MFHNQQQQQPIHESDRNSVKSKSGPVQTSPTDVPSLNNVVRKISGLIDNNLLPNFEKVSPPFDDPTRCVDPSEDPLPSYLEVADVEYVINKIADQIEDGLREGKMAILGPGVEVLIPCDLIKQIAQDVVASSETEPCGLRGCIMYINLEEDQTTAASGRRNSSSIHGDCNSKEFRRITCIKPIGSNPVPTFELTLNLKRCKTGWFNSVSSKLFHNSFFGGKQPIVISDSYQLSKRKLFR